MSLLDGIKDAMINPLYDSIMESDMDDDLDFEFALEAAVDTALELSDDDIAAILDDDNPDNIAADLTTKDENASKIADAAVEDALESALAELLALEQDDDYMPEKDDPKTHPDDVAEECGDDDDYIAEECGDEDSDDITLDSLLDSIL